MLFKFLEKPLTIHALIDEKNTHVYTFHPILPGIKCIPQWWKNTPKSFFNFDNFSNYNTVKGCPGIIENFKNSFITRLWTDIAITSTKDEWKYQSADRQTDIDFHSNGQAPNFYDNYHFLKLLSPWHLRTSKETKIVITQPFFWNNSPLPFISPVGIAPTINKFFDLNMFMFLEKTVERKNIMLKENTPIIQFFPLTESKIIFKIEPVSSDEFKKSRNTIESKYFNNGGINIIRKIRNYNG